MSDEFATTNFATRVFELDSNSALNALTRVLAGLPIDLERPLKVTIEAHKKIRTKEQNALMWVSRTNAIAEQAWVKGLQFSATTWHEYLKSKFLPEAGCEDYDKMVTKHYKKWELMPDGNMKCTGSTTHLTTFGFTVYLEKCDAYAVTELGVRFDSWG